MYFKKGTETDLIALQNKVCTHCMLWVTEKDINGRCLATISYNNRSKKCFSFSGKCFGHCLKNIHFYRYVKTSYIFSEIRIFFVIQWNSSYFSVEQEDNYTFRSLYIFFQDVQIFYSVNVSRRQLLGYKPIQMTILDVVLRFWVCNLSCVNVQ